MPARSQRLAEFCGFFYGFEIKEGTGKREKARWGSDYRAVICSLSGRKGDISGVCEPRGTETMDRARLRRRSYRPGA